MGREVLGKRPAVRRPGTPGMPGKAICRYLFPAKLAGQRLGEGGLPHVRRPADQQNPEIA